MSFYHFDIGFQERLHLGLHNAMNDLDLYLPGSETDGHGDSSKRFTTSERNTKWIRKIAYSRILLILQTNSDENNYN